MAYDSNLAETLAELRDSRLRRDELEVQLSRATAQLENVLDSHAEGTWQARALDAERENFALKAALKPSTVKELETQLSRATAEIAGLKAVVEAAVPGMRLLSKVCSSSDVADDYLEAFDAAMIKLKGTT